MSNEKNLPYAVVCGGVNIDIGAHSFAPLRDRDSNPGRVELSLGGVGRNIAHNMRLLGVPTYLLTAVGGDSRASQVEESCKELGIDLSHALRVPDGRTSTYVFVGDSDGDMAVAVSDMEICEKLTPDYFASQKELLDGAAAVLVGSADFGRASGLKPRARVRAFASIGSEPAIMLTGPMSCTERLLKRAGMQIGDIDLFEVNEAFASVVMSYMRHFDLPHDKVNVAGGAIALGHPLGATGAMLLGTVLDEMERRDLNTAVITLCAAAGMATATLIERV